MSWKLLCSEICLTMSSILRECFVVQSKIPRRTYKQLMSANSPFDRSSGKEKILFLLWDQAEDTHQSRGGLR